MTTKLLESARDVKDASEEEIEDWCPDMLIDQVWNLCVKAGKRTRISAFQSLFSLVCYYVLAFHRTLYIAVFT